MLTPSAVSTSALPERRVMVRLPCLATFSPAPAATKATAVETLKVETPVPPVPQTSITWCGCLSTTAARRITRAQAVISPTVSPRSRMAVTAAATWPGSARP